MLAKRATSAIFITIIALALILAGSWIFAGGVALIIALAVYEFTSMFRGGGYFPSPVLSAFATFIYVVLANLQDPAFSAFALIGSFFIFSCASIIRYRNNPSTAAIDLVIELASLLLIAIPGAFLIPLRNLPDGLYWTIAGVGFAWVGDVGAYAIGSLFGEHKLARQISPQKTIEGYFGGVIGAILAAAATGFIAQARSVDIPVVNSIVLGLLIGVLSPIGDLTKSIFKRSFSLKDTGNLIPGHGGILDRIDTVLWAAPIAYFFILFLG